MIDERQFDSLVAGFYSAATGASSWDAALTGLQLAFDARVAVLQSVDLSSGRILKLDAGGPSIHDCALQYLREYFAIDPRRRHLLAHTDEVLGHWWHDQDTYDDRFVAQDRYYQQFLPAYGMRFQSTVMLQPSPQMVAGLALELSAARGPLNDAERHLCERLGRHVSEALRAHERVRRMASQALAGHTLLDAFSYPMWLIGADRFIYHANAAARAWHGEHTHFDTRGGRLVWQADRTDRRLGQYLHAFGQGRHGMRAVIDARRRLSDAPSWLHLHALVPGRVLGAFGEQPQVLATLFDPTCMRQLDPFALAEIFGMTPTEGRVAALLAEGLTAQAIGDRLGCALSTVRTHLRRVLAKLGAQRLADAVRLLRQGEALWAQPLRAGAAPV